jgi:hypothetical protein
MGLSEEQLELWSLLERLMMTTIKKRSLIMGLAKVQIVMKLKKVSETGLLIGCLIQPHSENFSI